MPAYPSMYSMTFNVLNDSQCVQHNTSWECIDGHVPRWRTVTDFATLGVKIAMGPGTQGTNTATPPDPLLLVGGETAGLTKGKQMQDTQHKSQLRHIAAPHRTTVKLENDFRLAIDLLAKKTGRT